MVADSANTGEFWTLLEAEVVDAVFAPDASRIFATSGQFLFEIDVRSGQVLSEYEFDRTVGALDISPDGRHLAVTSYATFHAAETTTSLYRIDTMAGSVETYEFQRGSDLSGIFFDVAHLSDGSVLLSQSDRGPVLQFDFEEETLTTITATLTRPSLVPSGDRQVVFILDGSPQEFNSVFEVGRGITATWVETVDPHAGASVPFPRVFAAVDYHGDRLFEEGAILDRSLNRTGTMEIDGRGVALSPTGDTFYVAASDAVLEVDAATGDAFAAYRTAPVDYDDSLARRFANLVQVSADGQMLAVITSEGLQILDLRTAVPTATNEDDLLIDTGAYFGLGGNDTLGGVGVQDMVGGPGDDTYYVDDPSDRITEKADEGYDIVFAATSYQLSGHVEELIYTGEMDAYLFGNDQNNRIVGGPAADYIVGGAGDDELIGLAGNDTLVAGSGIATLIGGSGDDFYEVGHDDVVIELADEGIDTIQTNAESYTLPDHVENLQGSPFFDQVLTGNALDNVIDGGGGQNSLIGSLGDDTYHIHQPADQIIELTGEGYDVIHASFDGVILPDHVEGLVLGGHARDGTGNELDNKLVGSSNENLGFVGAHLKGMAGDDILITFDGHNILDGGTGADTMIGGRGDDLYYVDSPDDIIIEHPGEGIDAVVATISMTLPADVEALVLTGRLAVNGTGNAGDNVILGTDADNTLLGLAGDDVLAGGAGDDLLDGGPGHDVVYFEDARSEYSITRLEEGSYSIESSNEGQDILVGIEMLSFADAGYVWDDARGELISLARGDFALFASSGFTGAIGARGVVYGTRGQEDIAIVDRPGLIVFDASFNNGGDTIRLAGDADNWSVRLNGSAALMTDGDTFVLIPVGLGTTTLAFADGTRDLRIDLEANAFMIGDQAIELASARISSAGDPVAPPAGDPAASARLFLSSGAHLSVGGKTVVFGTHGAETVTAEPGSIVFDATFNQGGDTIRFQSEASQFSAMRSGSAVLLSDGITEALIPVGPHGTVLSFADGDLEFVFDGGMWIGSQLLGTEPVMLDAIA